MQEKEKKTQPMFSYAPFTSFVPEGPFKQISSAPHMEAWLIQAIWDQERKLNWVIRAAAHILALIELYSIETNYEPPKLSRNVKPLLWIIVESYQEFIWKGKPLNSNFHLVFSRSVELQARPFLCSIWWELKSNTTIGHQFAEGCGSTI